MTTEPAVEELSLGEQAEVYSRAHPTIFAKFTKKDYQDADVHWKIGDALRRAAEGEKCDDVECGCGVIDRLIIEAPPRHGKSELASVRFPAWYLGRNPTHRIIGTAYGSDLANNFGRQARNVMELPEFKSIFPGVRLAKDTAAAKEWNIEGTGGGYIAAGVGGPITGRGAHVLLIEDPVKNRQEAESEITREQLWDWYTSTAYTRLEGRGVVILIMTRWHEDDLAGRLIQKGKEDGDRFHVVRLPAISDGKALWPEKYNETTLDGIRKVIGPRDFGALYQQNPVPNEGNTFKAAWFKNFGKPPRDPPRWFVCQSIDTSLKGGVGHDPSVIATWATDFTSYYLLDVWRDRVEYPDLRRAVLQRAAQWSPHAVYIEDAANGQPLIQELRRNSRLPIIPINPRGGKEIRADSIAPIFESGNVVLPGDENGKMAFRPWLDDWVAEHLRFPSGTHDDQVDTTSMALTQLSRRIGTPSGQISLDYAGHKPEERYTNAFNRAKGRNHVETPNRASHGVRVGR